MSEVIDKALAACDRVIALGEQATPGPWKYDTYNTVVHGGIVVCSIPDHPDGESYYEAEQIAERSAWYKESQANAEFIAEYRNLAPAMAAALKVAIREFDIHRTECESWRVLSDNNEHPCTCGFDDFVEALCALRAPRETTA